jgi:phosphoribosylglycinamide formyltransferase-1
MATTFVGERIEPVPGTLDASLMARGEPGVPRRFRWRGAEHEVAEILGSEKRTGDCSHGSGERYVRRHLYRVRTAKGLVLTLSFDRSAVTRRELRASWWVQSMEEDEPPPPAGT